MHWPRLWQFFYTQPDRELALYVKRTAGYWPSQLSLYKLAFTHISTLKHGRLGPRECNERLEFLGDSILGSIIAEYLFQRYPTRDEGFLTETRSKIVNRTALNELALRLGLDSMLHYDAQGTHSNRTMFGNTLEAFIGALYLDQGYHRTYRFIIQHLLLQCLDLNALVEQDLNYKSKLMEFAQKNKLTPIRYQVVGQRQQGRGQSYTVAVLVGEEVMGYGTDVKKKNAEQRASEMALQKLNLQA